MLNIEGITGGEFPVLFPTILAKPAMTTNLHRQDGRSRLAPSPSSNVTHGKNKT